MNKMNVIILSYRKIPIISPGLIFVQKTFLLGLFLGELIFGGACYRKKFCISKLVWFVNENSNSNSPWAYIREGLLSEGYLRLRFGGLIFGRAYFEGGVIIGILLILSLAPNTQTKHK